MKYACVICSLNVFIFALFSMFLLVLEKEKVKELRGKTVSPLSTGGWISQF
jgi:hypothetical protein